MAEEPDRRSATIHAGVEGDHGPLHCGTVYSAKRFVLLRCFSLLPAAAADALEILVAFVQIETLGTQKNKVKLGLVGAVERRCFKNMRVFVAHF